MACEHKKERYIWGKPKGIRAGKRWLCEHKKDRYTWGKLKGIREGKRWHVSIRRTETYRVKGVRVWGKDCAVSIRRI